MEDVLVIGAGPAGLLSAWLARRAGLRVRLLTAGIGTTHISPGWIGVLAEAGGDGGLRAALDRFATGHPGHPYALAGPDALVAGIAALREVCSTAGINYVGNPEGENFLLPTALGGAQPAAFAPESFVAGDLRKRDPILIAGPLGWRDFYPELCAGNLARQGVPAEAMTFELPESQTGQFDPTPGALARLFDQPGVRGRVAAQIKPYIARHGPARVGLPAIVGFERHAEAWRDLSQALGVPVFEIPTLPPSVPGMRLFNAFETALHRAGVAILLDMTVSRGLCDGKRVLGVAVPGPVRETIFRAGQVILATGGLYGGGILTDHHGNMQEVVFGLPVAGPHSMADWFDDRLLNEAGHLIAHAGVRANTQMQPVGPDGDVLLDNVRLAGRLLAGANPVVEGSTEGAWLATAYLAARCAIEAARDEVTQS